ncbi:MAG: DUF4124 domain-containing protein [Cocleimonas sp.]
MKKAILLGTLIVMSLSVQAGLYRWVDDAGNVHFSDKVPAAASKKSHAELNKQGDITKAIDPEAVIQSNRDMALYDENLKKQFLLDQIKKEAEAVIKKRDEYLLSTYENKGELVHSFETKIKMLNGSAKIIEAQNVVLNKKVIKLEKSKSNIKSKNSILNIDVKIVDIHTTIEQYKQALKDNNEQVTKLTMNYQEDLTRYMDLTE